MGSAKACVTPSAATDGGYENAEPRWLPKQHRIEVVDIGGLAWYGAFIVLADRLENGRVCREGLKLRVDGRGRFGAILSWQSKALLAEDGGVFIAACSLTCDMRSESDFEYARLGERSAHSDV